MLDTVIRNAWIVDGTGNPRYRGHIGIKDGRIATICRGADVPDAGHVIDAGGRTVCPGFIDIHTHTDYTIYHHNTALSSLTAGVTTEVMGMCGHTVFPVTTLTRPQIGRSVALFSGLAVDEVPEPEWEGLAGWLEVLDRRGVGVNVAQMAGHGMLRTAAMGPEDKGGEVILPSRAQMDEMKRLLTEAMDEGAFGLATGLGYPPGRNATTDEVALLAAIAARYGGAYISHIRSESEHLAWSLQELIEIARRSGIRASASHHKAMGWENWGKISHTLDMIESARRAGTEVMVDFYPWVHAAQSNLGASFYASFDSAGRDRESLLKTLGDDDTYRELKACLLNAWSRAQEGAVRRRDALAPHGIPAPTSVLSPETQYLVHSGSRPGLVGMNLAQACRAEGAGTDPESLLDVLRRIYLDDEGHTYVAGGSMSEDDLDTLIRHPLAAISTDGWTLSGPIDLGYPSMHIHPRQYGTHARVLEVYTRERGLIPVEEAVRKMTGLPANLLGVDDRGLVREGMWADLVVFDPDLVGNRATHSGPQVPPAGIHWVLVNGGVAVDGGQPTGSLHGQVLRRR